MGFPIWPKEPAVVKTLKIRRQNATQSDTAESIRRKRHYVRQLSIQQRTLLKIFDCLMESGGQYLVRHRINGLDLKSAVGSVKSSVRMVHAQGRRHERPSLDPSREVCIHRRDHRPEMFLAKLVQHAKIANNHKLRNRMLAVLDRNWLFRPIDVYTIVKMRPHDRIGYTFRVHSTGV